MSKEFFKAENKLRGKAKTVFGVGINDYDGKTVNPDGSRCHVYLRWKALLHRCYSVYALKLKDQYKDVVVCDEWLSYSNFRKWYTTQIGCDLGYHIDKDLLTHGDKVAKVYSPETCVLVPREINVFMINTENNGSELPIGVYFHKNNKLYKSQINEFGKRKCLGYFKTPEEAFHAYKEAKESQAKLLADKFKGKICERTYNALMNYKVNIED